MTSIYQIHLTKEESDTINELGWGQAVKSSPKIKAYLARSIDGISVEDLQYFDLVAKTECEDLEMIFEEMNLYQGKIEIEAFAPYYSMSVGDVIVKDNGDTFVVASVGFKQINI